MRKATRIFAIASAVVAGPLLATTAVTIRDYISTEQADPEEDFELGSVFVGSSGTPSLQCWDDAGSTCTVTGPSRDEPGWVPGRDWDWTGGGDYGGGRSSNQDGGGDSGTPSDPDGRCDAISMKADQFAAYVNNQRTAPYGPVNPSSFDIARPDKLFAEFIAFWGQSNDVNAYVTRGNTRFNPPWDQLTDSLQGFSHNHTEWIWQDGDWRQLSRDERLIGRYPSASDWNVLAEIAERYGDVTMNHNPSMYLIDSFGVHRQFKLSERSYFEAMANGNLIRGDGLTERERTNLNCQTR